MWQVQKALTTLAKASELIGNQFHYGSQMPDGDVFSIIDLTERTVSVMYVYVINQYRAGGKEKGNSSHG